MDAITIAFLALVYGIFNGVSKKDTPTKKVEDFLASLAGNSKGEQKKYKFISIFAFSFATPFRGNLPSFEVNTFNGFLSEEKVLHEISDGVKTTDIYYPIKGGKYCVETTRTYETLFFILFCLDETSNMLCGFILESDKWGNLSFVDKFYDDHLYIKVDGLSDEELSKKIKNFTSQMKVKFETFHRLNLVKKQFFDGITSDFECLPLPLINELHEEQKKWESEQDDEPVEEEEYYDGDDVDDFQAENSCHHRKGGKGGKTDRQRKKDKNRQRFQSGLKPRK